MVQIEEWEEEERIETHEIVSEVLEEESFVLEPDASVSETKDDSNGKIDAHVAKEEGNEAFRRRDFDRAALRYTESMRSVLEGDKDVENVEQWNATLRTNRAQAYLRLGRFADALEDCKVAVGLDPDRTKAWYHGALASFRMQDFELAEEWFRKAQELQPEDTGTQSMVERCRAEIGNQEAASCVKEMAARDKESYGPARVGRSGRLESPSDLLVIEEAIRMLVDDEDEDDAMAVDAILDLLAGVLERSANNRQYFAACGGYTAVMLYLNESYCEKAYCALRAASGEGQDGGIYWPKSFVDRLLHLSTSEGVPSKVLTVLLQLLELCSRDLFMRTGLLTSRQEVGEKELPLKHLLDHARHAYFQQVLSVTGAHALTSILENFALDSTSRTALYMVDASPLQFLVYLYHQAEKLVGAFSASKGQSFEESEFKDAEEFLEFALREKQRLYDKPVIHLRKSILHCLMLLSKDLQLLQAEAFSTRSDRTGKSHAVTTDLLKDLYDLLQKLKNDSPLKTAPCLGLDGKVKSYEKRPFAADYLRNPTGDLLLQLEDGDVQVGSPCPKLRADLDEKTQLELALAWLSACTASKRACRVLVGKGVLDLMEELWAFTSPSVLHLAKWVCSRFCLQCERAATDLLEQSNVTSSSALLLVNKAPLLLRGLHAVLLNLSTCSGDEFSEWSGADGGLRKVACLLDTEGLQSLGLEWEDVKQEKILKVAGDVFLRTLERARRCQGLPTGKFPKGGAWDMIGARVIMETECRILGLEVPATSPPISHQHLSGSTHTCSAPQMGGNVSSTPISNGSSPGRRFRDVVGEKPNLVKKGFFGGRSKRSGRGAAPTPGPKIAAEPTRACMEQTSAQTEEDTIPVWLQDKKEQAQDDEAGGFDEDGLKVVFDSAPSQEERERRQKWIDIPLKDRFSWTQTTSELIVTVKLPHGTRGKDLHVKVTSTRLTISLNWYGRVLDGPLSRRCKASDSHWSLDGTELTILIPKDDGYFWRSLFEGGEEKSHYEVLKELVNADEPNVPYDELDDDAKELLEELRERQELINEGLIDPEAFDDFRCVIGDGDGAK